MKTMKLLGHLNKADWKVKMEFFGARIIWCYAQFKGPSSFVRFMSD